MTVEAATTINQLNAANPAGTDSTDRGDDHIRLIKSVLLTTFPNLTGPITATEADLNSVATINTALGTFLLLDGSRPMAGNLAMGGNKVTGLAAPTADADAATKLYVDQAVAAAVQATAAQRASEFPVGRRLFLGLTNANPSSFLGFGTWQLVGQDRVMVGAGGRYNRGDTGGRETVTLTTQQLPAHSHRLFVSGGTVSSNTRLASTNSAADLAIPGFQGSDFRYGIVGVSEDANVGNSSEVGSGQAVDIRPLYEAVNIWQRTA
ncbi:MAG: hypothetical protein AAF608_05075 [Pseudomonadota bacterium]